MARVMENKTLTTWVRKVVQSPFECCTLALKNLEWMALERAKQDRLTAMKMMMQSSTRNFMVHGSEPPWTWRRRTARIARSGLSLLSSHTLGRQGVQGQKSESADKWTHDWQHDLLNIDQKPVAHQTRCDSASRQPGRHKRPMSGTYRSDQVSRRANNEGHEALNEKEHKKTLISTVRST